MSQPIWKEKTPDPPLILTRESAVSRSVVRRPARLSERYREITKSQKVWGKPILRLCQGQNARVLDTWEEIRDATAAGVPIVSHTEVRNSGMKLRAIIECPVKTMNISLQRKMYQVDTGLIAFPDL